MRFCHIIERHIQRVRERKETDRKIDRVRDAQTERHRQRVCDVYVYVRGSERQRQCVIINIGKAHPQKFSRMLENAFCQDESDRYGDTGKEYQKDTERQRDRETERKKETQTKIDTGRACDTHMRV